VDFGSSVAERRLDFFNRHVGDGSERIAEESALFVLSSSDDLIG